MHEQIIPHLLSKKSFTEKEIRPPKRLLLLQGPRVTYLDLGGVMLHLKIVL